MIWLAELPHITRPNLPSHVLCPVPHFHFFERSYYWASSSGSQLSLQLRTCFAGHCCSLGDDLFSSAGNGAAAPSRADVASPVMFLFFGPNLFLSLCKHPSHAVTGVVSLLSGALWLKSSHRLSVFWHNPLPLWKTVWNFLRKLKMELPFDPVIPLLGLYSK